MASKCSRVLLGVMLAATAATLVMLVPHDLQALRALGEAVGPWAPFLLLAVWIVGTPLLVPGTLLCAVGGLLLGPLGVAVSLLGSPLGALTAFALGRLILGPGLLERLPERFAGVVARIEAGGMRSVALLRMAPGMPVAAFNYGCGTTRLRPRSFALGSAVGAAPRVILYGALGGAAAQAGPLVALIGAGVAALFGLGLLVRRSLRPAATAAA